MIGLGALVVVIVVAVAAFAGPIGEQLTGAFFLVNREGTVARLRPDAISTVTTSAVSNNTSPVVGIATTPVRNDRTRLATCNKNLEDCNACLDIIKHTRSNDLTHWMGANGVSENTVTNCTNRIGADLMSGIGNLGYINSDIARKAAVCGQALLIKNYGGNYAKFLTENVNDPVTAQECSTLGYNTLVN